MYANEDPVAAALLWRFARAGVDLPEPGRTLFLNAAYTPSMDEAWRKGVICVQPHRASFETLHKAGFQTHDIAPERTDFALTLARLGRDRQEGRGFLAIAWQNTAPGGIIFAAGAKNDGGASHERDMAALTALAGIEPKAGCRIFWLVKPDLPSREQNEQMANWLQAASPARNVDDTFFTQPGLFSWQAIDEGSKLLVAHLPAKLSGAIADLGCGWGYLARAILHHTVKLTALDLYDADSRALSCARENLQPFSKDAPISYHWHDVTRGLPAEKRYNWILTNPPFHRARAAEPGLGQSFIDKAARALHPSGTVLLVANRSLPYEETLARLFGEVSCVVETADYKILQARRPRPLEQTRSARQNRR